MADKSIRERMMAGLSKNKSATTGYTAQSKDDIRRRALGGINAGERTRTLRNENRYYTETLKNSPYSSIGSRLDTAIADFNTRISKMSEYDSDAAGSSDSYAKTLEGIRSDINSLYKDQAYKYAQGLVSQNDMERITGVRTAISQELDDLLQGNKQILKYYDQYADESDFYASAGGQSLNALKGNIEKAQSDYNSKASAYDTASNKRTEYVNARDYIKRYSDPAASTDDDRYFHYTDFLTGETYNIPESLMNDDLYWHYKDFLTGNTFETNDEIENLRSERDTANESYRTQQSEYEKTENRANAVRAEVDARKDPRFDEIANETRFVKSDMSDRKRLEMEVRAYMWPQTDPDASDKKRISAMTDDQLKTLSYLLHKNGRTSGATDYYNSLTDELTATAAEKLAGSYNWIGSRLFHSIPSGIERFNLGLSNALRATVGTITGDTEPLPEGVYSAASPLVREQLGTVGGVVYDVAENISNNAPSMIAGAFNPVIGAAMLGTSAGGNAYSEGIKSGMSPAEARVYGVSVGITETMLERYLGTLPGIGKNGFAAKASEALGESLNVTRANSIKNVMKKGGMWIAKQLADNSGEFVEESLQEIIEPFIKWAVSSVGGSDVEVDWPGIDDVLYAGFIGIATSMLTNGAANTTAAVYDSIKNREFNSNVRKTGARAIASEAGIKDIQALAAAGIKSDNEYLRAQAQRVQASFADGKFNIKDSEIGKLIYYSELAVMNKQNEISTGSENNIITTIKQAAAVSADEATSIYDSMIAAANGAEVSTELQNIMSTNSSVRQIFEDISSGAETTRILERVKNENGEIVDALDNLAETMSAEAEPEAEYNDPVSVARYDEYGKMIVRDSSGAEFEYNDDSETISGRAKAKLEYAKDFAANGANTYYRLAPNRASETYNATFGLLYNQGIRGEEFHAYENSDISEEKQRAIYDAGRRDAEVDNAAATKANEIAQKKEASRKERTTPARGEVVTSAAVDALIRSTTNKVMQQQYLDTISATEALAKFLGARIEFYVGEADGTGKITSQLGLYDSATNTFRFDILAGTNNIKARTYSAMLRVAGHELTHFIQNWSPTKYNTLKRETLDFLKSEKSNYTEWLREEIRKKQEANAPFGKMTVEQATDEIVSDAFESVLANEEFITKLYASDAGLTKRVNNWANKYYKQFSEGLKSAFITDELTEAGKIMRAAGERAQKVYEQWIDAFAHATYNALLFEPSGNSAQNMTRPDIQDQITKEYQTEVDLILNMKSTRRNSLVIGYTPELMLELGAPNVPFTIGTGHVYSMAKTKSQAKKDGNYKVGTHYHGMGAAAVKNIYQSLLNPVMIIASKDSTYHPDRSKHSVVAIIDIGSPKQPLLAAVEITATRTVNGSRMNVNALSSAYPKGVGNLIADAVKLENNGDVGIYYANKKAIPLTRAGVLFPIRAQNKMASNSIIHTFPEKVNMIISNDTESIQFKRFFGDWQTYPARASKVVNPDGSPMRGFCRIDEKTAQPVRNGVGFLVESTAPDQNTKSASVMETYTNIRKPLTIEKNYGDWSGNTVANNLLKDGVFSNDEKTEERLREILEISSEKNGKSVAEQKNDGVKALLKKLGYDGIQFLNSSENGQKSYSYIAFESQQLKSATDNVGTYGKTDNIYRMTREQEREAEDRWYDLEARAERGEAENEIIDFLGRGKNKPRIYVPASLSEDIVRWFDVPGRKAVDTLRNRYIGNMTITSDESARGIDSLYAELSEKFGQDWFPDTYDEAQKLLNITKVFDAARAGRDAQMEIDSDNIPASPLGLRKKNGYVDPSIRRDLSRIMKDIASRRPKNGAKLLEVLKTYDDALNRYSDALDALTYARKNGDEADITLANTNVQVAEMGLLAIESLPEMSIAFTQVAAMTNSKANSGKDSMTEREAADVKEYYGEARDRKLRKLTQDYRAMLTETERAAKDAIWHAENAERRIERVRQTERKNNVRKDLSKTLSKLTAAKERPTERTSLPVGSDKLYTSITDAIHAADEVMQLRGLPRAPSEVVDMIVNASIAQANGTKTHKGVNAEAVNNLISETNAALTALQSRIKAIKSELEALDPQSPAALVRANESDENSRSFVSMLDELISENISQLYGEDIITYVRDCAETISALSYSLMNANRAMVNGRMVDIIKLRDDLKKGADAMKNSPYKNLPNYFLSPETVFTIYLGETEAKNAFYNLHRDAMMKEVEYKNGASDLISKITNAEELNNPEKLIDSGLEDTAGKPVKLTQDLAIAFILTVAQEDGLRHAVSGGMRLPNIETLYKNPGKAFTEIRETPHIFEKESMERLDELQKQRTEALENGDRTAYFDIGINMTAIRTALGELREKMSDRYREAAKKLESGLDANGRNALNIIRRYYNEYSRSKLDEATMERWGFTKTRKDNYYPIRVVREQIRSDDKNSLIKHDATIESWGPMKNRVVSKNGIYLYGAMSSLGDQINAAARYYSMLNLMNTENKLMLSTFSATNTDNENLTNLKSYIDSLSVREKNGKTQYKESFSNYLDELEMNYVGEHKGESGGFAMKALSMFTRASLFSNFSPILRQRTAGIQAAPITGFRNAVAALHGKGQKDISTWRRIANTIGIIPMLSKEQVQDVAKYSQLYKYRAGGALNVDFAELKKYKSVNAFLKNRTQETQNKAEKVKSILLEGGGMELMDMMTLGSQFYACVEAAKQQHPSLDLVEQKKIAGKMLDEVIMTSQPNNADLLKAPLYRRNDVGRLLFGIFTGQPNVMVNSLINKSAAVYSLQKQAQSDSSKASELKKAKKTLTSAAAAIATSVALDTLVGVAVSAIRGFVYDKDDEDKTLGESAIEFTEDYIFGLLGLLPIIGDVAETVRNIWEGKGYYAGNTFSIGALENINDGIRALADLPMKAINGKLTWSAAKKDIADALAIFGISGRMVQVVLRMIELAAGIK